MRVSDEKPGLLFSGGCSKRELSIVARAREFAEDELNGKIEAWEAERRVPLEALRRAAAEFGGLMVSKEHGGHEASIRTFAAVMAAIARVDLAFAFSLVVHINLSGAVSRVGTASQRDRYLKDMLSGKCIGAFCLTEPDAGTDAAGIRTTARRADDAWVVDGSKAWITNGTVAGLFCVFARTQTGEGSAADMAAFLVDGANPSLEREPGYHLMGGNVMGTTGIALRSARATDSDVFAQPGEGFKLAMQGIDFARVVLSAMCCAILEDGLSRAASYACKRQAFGRRIIDFQGLQFGLADVATQLESAIALTDRAIAILDDGRDVRIAAAHAKKFSTKAAFDGLTQCMQAMGAYGFRRDHPLPRHLSNAKMAQYLDGTTEVQNIVIGRGLAGKS